MSIFKDTFRGYVRDQLALREELINIGNTSDSGNRRDRMGYNTVNLQSGKRITLNPGTYYNYSLSKQCVIRMTSLVDYVEDIKLPLSKFENLRGANLSRRFILEGGTLGVGSKTKSSFITPTKKSNTAYGDPYIASNSSQDGYGIVPMPGITNATIRTKSAYGSLREAKINFECHNRRQLEILEMLYMRPGYMAVVEWGWTPYIGNDGKLKSNLNLIENKVGALEDGTSKLYTNEITQMGVYNAINRLKEQSGGNYDAFLGIVKNFGFQAREDGGYTCFTEMTSMNEVIDSIKTPNISIFDPKLGNVVQTGRYPSQTNEIIISSNLGIDENRRIDEFNFVLNEQKFDKALEAGLFPQFNGLEGLTKNLKIYTTFNSFTLSSVINSDEILADEGIGNALGESIYGDDLEDIFGEFNEEGQATAQNELNYEIGTGQGDPNDPKVNKAVFKTLQRDLLRFKAKSVQRILSKKLNLSSGNDPNAAYPENPSSLGELRNYIIPKQGFETSPTAIFDPEGITAESVEERRERESLNEMTVYDGGFTPEDAGIEIKGLDERYIRKNDQSFIRWDALLLLMNEALVVTNEKGEKPVYIVCDKIVDLGNKTSRYDPLKYNQILVTDPRPVDSTSTEGLHRAMGITSGKVVIDFSCDPNICILPHQFDENIKIAQKRQSDYFPPDNYVEVIGYEPDTSMFTNKYHTSIFDKDPGTVLYDDKTLKPGTRLNTTDKNFRIGNIFLNIEMLDEIAEKNSDKTDYTIGNFINDIWAKVNEVCPNHNFVLTDDKEANVCYIIDLPVNQKDIPKDYHEFIPFSNKNVLREFNYTSNVPNALSATIAIQAQDPRSIQDIDGVTFAVFNRAIKNRIQSADTTSNFSKTKNAINNGEIERVLKNQELFEELINFQIQFFENITAQANDKKLPANNIKGVLKQFQANSEYINVAKDAKKGSSFNSVIPLEFNAELDGISGMVIGNIFKIQKDRLPRAYKNANIGFIVFNEEQSITAGGDWTTKIGGKMTILND